MTGALHADRHMLPVVYFRFEDATRPGLDSMGHFDLQPTAASTVALPSPTPARPFNSTHRACTFHTGQNRTLLPTALGGDIDEVAVWTTALSDTHIAAHADGAL